MSETTTDPNDPNEFQGPRRERSNRGDDGTQTRDPDESSDPSAEPLPETETTTEPTTEPAPPPAPPAPPAPPKK
jgi:hypothetical protein